MRLFSPTVSQLYWRDRAPLAIHESKTAVLVAGVTALFWTYTVPALRVGLVEIVSTSLGLSQVLAVGDNVYILIRIRDETAAIVTDDVVMLQHGEGPGTMFFPPRGPYQLPTGYKLQLQAFASAGYTGCEVGGHAFGVEYDE